MWETWIWSLRWEDPLEEGMVYNQFSSVTQSCLALCDPLDCSMPGFSTHYQLQEFA